MPKQVLFIGDQISKQPQSYYEKMLLEYGEKWDTDIIVCICHGRVETIPAELVFDKLYIFAQVLPREFQGVQKHTVKSYKINGKEVIFPEKEDAAQKCPQGDTLSFTKAPDRAAIIRDDDGIAMAAVFDGNIYILNDFIHTRNKEELDIGMALLKHILDYAEKKLDLLKQLKSGVEEKSKRSLENALKQQFTIRLDKEAIQLKAAKDTVETYAKNIVEAQRKIISTEKILEALRKNIEDVPSALEKTWKSLSRMSNSMSYSSISFTKSGIRAITTPIVVKHGGKEYDMGRFDITLQFDGVCKANNLDHKVDNYDHPHVNAGQFCWGNFSGWIPKLVGASEFDVALDQIYTFLCHYDSASPYKPLEAWPLLAKKGVVSEIFAPVDSDDSDEGDDDDNDEEDDN